MGSTLKTDTILMTIYTLKFASNLPSFEVVLGYATNELPTIIELGGSQFKVMKIKDDDLFELF